MFRVWDSYEKKWVKEDIYLSTADDLVLCEKKLFNFAMTLIPQSRYIYHNWIGLNDKDGTPIFEGDILECHNIKLQVLYVTEKAAYMMFDHLTEQCFFVTGDMIVNGKVVGNIVENRDLIFKQEG